MRGEDWKQAMSKPIKNLIVDSYKRRFEGLTGAVVIDIRGVEANDNNALRSELNGKGVKVTVVKNSLAQRAFAETDLESLNDLLDGPCALAFGQNEDVSVVNVARALIDKVKELENLEFKGAVMEGVVFGADEVEALSKYPTREEAQAQIISVVLGAAGNLISTFTGAGNEIASIVATVEDKLEKGEAIEKVA